MNVRERWHLWRVQRGYRRRFRQRLADWLWYHQTEVVMTKPTWCGVLCQHLPSDAWIYQEIIWTVKPDVIVEIGSNEGGSTLFLAHLLDIIGGGAVVSVDIDRTHFHATHPRITTITGNSSDREVVAQVRAHCTDKRVLVIHDGDHHAAQVERDLEAYAPLVTVGSYLIVEDGIVDVSSVGGEYLPRGTGPLAASERFLRRHPAFVVDEGCERYRLTYNPRGYLKRVSD